MLNLKKDQQNMIKNSICASPEEIVTALPISIFFNKIFKLYFQIVGLSKKLLETLLIDQTYLMIEYIRKL